MYLTPKEWWTALHGMVFGAGFLLAFTGGFVAICNLAPSQGISPQLTGELADRKTRRTALALTAVALLAWLTVLLGTYMIYPWYRAKPPANESAIALADYPKYLLLSNPQTARWHEFAMEWKEHIGWLTPILASAVAFIALRYGRLLSRDASLRRAVLFLFTAAFFCASIAGVFGALINKSGPVR